MSAESYFPLINACKNRIAEVGHERYDHVRVAISEWTGLKVEDTRPKDMAYVLMGCIGHTTKPTSLRDILEAMDPDPMFSFMRTDNRPYWERACGALIGILQMTEVSYIPGYREWHDREFPNWQKENG